MRFKYFGLFFLIALLPLSACGNGGKKTVDILKEAYAVEAGDGRYVSDFFKLSVEKPEDWYVSPREELNEILQVGAETLAGDDENTRRAIKSGMKKTLPVFGFFKYEMGAPVDFNHNLLVLGENVKLSPGIKTGEDYFFHHKQLIKNSGLEVVFADDYGSREIAGRNFASLDSVTTFGNVSVLQTVYLHRNDDYFLILIKSYGNDEGSQEMDAILDSIKIDW